MLINASSLKVHNLQFIHEVPILINKMFWKLETHGLGGGQHNLGTEKTFQNISALIKCVSEVTLWQGLRTHEEDNVEIWNVHSVVDILTRPAVQLTTTDAGRRGTKQDRKCENLFNRLYAGSSR